MSREPTDAELRAFIEATAFEHDTEWRPGPLRTHGWTVDDELEHRHYWRAYWQKAGCPTGKADPPLDGVDLGVGVDAHAAALKAKQTPAQEAIDVIAERRKSYGSPKQNFERIAGFWSVYLGRPMTPVDVATMMRLVKEARLMETPDHRDSLVDLVGYVECHADVLEGV